MSAAARQEAIRQIASKQPVTTGIDYVKKPITELFGENVFSMSAMRAALPAVAFDAVVRTIERGDRLDPVHADTIATAMKVWAIERGATHYTHWFQPMTGLTAEKHDAFIAYTREGTAITEFSGKTLVKGEPDASSFPSGGIRATFEARGYTAWDPTSPAFLVDGANGKTLYIPTAFCGYNGHALDKKTPLLRSIEALSRHATRLLRLLGNKEVQRVVSTVGPEQEYFLVDRQFYFLRPDLVNCGRTLFGAKPPKGQELEDHYFGSIRARVLSFMMEAEAECYRLGIPIKTRHNEVAPGQFEVAPIFELANVAADHNMLAMEVMRSVANRHGFHCLLHEKPYAGVNGSGKHNNWSLADDKGNNLLEPGHSPEEDAQFLVILSAVLRAVNKWGKVLRAGIATAGNDHRLGANEAPPAIISVYLGEKLSEVVQGLVTGAKGARREGGILDIGVQALPSLPRDASDRNRTSPFAFTGNKFEFRAVGSSQNIARPMSYLNTIVADSLDYVATQIEARTKSGKSLHDAVQAVVAETLAESQRVIFNGDNYTKEWYQEAEKRGLPNLRNCVDAAAVLAEPDVAALFAKYGVLTEEESASRHKVILEQYVKTIHIEALMTSSIATQMILPASLAYQRSLAETVVKTREALPGQGGTAAGSALAKVTEHAKELWDAIAKLDAVRAEADAQHGDVTTHARYYRDRVVPAMDAVRQSADALEGIVDDSVWPLPKYREMLFVY